MKKLLLVITAILISLSIYAQENNPENLSNEEPTLIEQKQYVYCELLGKGKLLSSKVTVDIDFGQPVSFWAPDRRYKDENGKAVAFNSMVDAMNFMGSLGWEFVQAYVVTESNQNVYHWLLKMEIKGNSF
jgi:hypothetical protein